jgi:hypothetical protein
MRHEITFPLGKRTETKPISWAMAPTWSRFASLRKPSTFQAAYGMQKTPLARRMAAIASPDAEGEEIGSRTLLERSKTKQSFSAEVEVLVKVMFQLAPEPSRVWLIDAILIGQCRRLIFDCGAIEWDPF